MAIGRLVNPFLDAAKRKGLGTIDAYDPFNIGIPGSPGVLSGAAPYLAGGVLAAGALAPQDAEASFIGKLSEVWPHDMEGMAIKMKDYGLPREEIWQKTGIDLETVDGKPRTEIPDNPQGISKMGADEVRDYGWRAQRRINDQPHIYAAHPDMGGIKTGWENMPGYSASYDNTTDSITHNVGVLDGVRNRTPGQWQGKLDELNSSNAHELQHAIQKREGFARGGNTEMFAREAALAEQDISGINDKLSQILRAKDNALAGGNEQGASLLQAEYEGLLNSRQRLVPTAQLDPNESYRKLAGEVEARNVETRLNMTPKQRRAIPPWWSADVPEREQIVRMRGSATPGALAATAAATGAGMLAKGMFSPSDAQAAMQGEGLKTGMDMLTGAAADAGQFLYGALSAPVNAMLGGDASTSFREATEKPWRETQTQGGQAFDNLLSGTGSAVMASGSPFSNQTVGQDIGGVLRSAGNAYSGKVRPLMENYLGKQGAEVAEGLGIGAGGVLATLGLPGNTRRMVGAIVDAPEIPNTTGVLALPNPERARVENAVARDAEWQGLEAANRNVGIKRNKSGRYIGGPAGVLSSQKRTAIVKQYDDRTQAALDAGIPPGYFYEEGRNALARVTDNPQEHSMVANAMGPTSTQVGPYDNTNYMIRGLDQKAMGVPTSVTLYPNSHRRKMDAVMAGEDPWKGFKVDRYSYLLGPRDPHVNPLQNMPQNDQWEGYGVGFPKSTVPSGPTQVAWADDIRERAADRINGRRAAQGDRPLTREEIQELHWASIRAETEGRPLQLNQNDTIQGSLDQLRAQGAWEAEPGASAGLTRLSSKEDYADNVYGVLSDDQGKDRLVRSMGGRLQDPIVRGTGVWGDELSPGFQSPSYVSHTQARGLEAKGELKQNQKLTYALEVLGTQGAEALREKIGSGLVPAAVMGVLGLGALSSPNDAMAGEKKPKTKPKPSVKQNFSAMSRADRLEAMERQALGLPPIVKKKK